MLTLYRRHRAGCKYKSRRAKCFCAIWTQGVLRGEKIRQPLDLTNWEAANKRVRDWEIHGKANSLSLLDACDRYISQGEANGLSVDTLNRQRLLKRQFEEFFGDVQLRAITLDDVSRFRESWKMSNVSARKKIERLRSFFKFCMDREWIEKNPAGALKLPKEIVLRVKPYEAAELEKIEWAIPLFPAKGIYGEKNRDRIKAFITILRWTGLRIRDVVVLPWERLDETHITLRTQKNGKPVKIRIHPDVAKALTKLAPTGTYIFWSGEGNPKSAVGDWQRTLRRLGELAGVHIHAHRWRHSFAIELLSKGIPVSEVAAILGNSPRIVEKHYNQFIQSRQQALDRYVEAIW
jgi:integrase/recombinase XerD